jgi:hypothetical protein
MALTSQMGLVAVLAWLGLWPLRTMDPNACSLLSAQDAAAIVGPPVAMTHTESNAAFSTCLYRRPGENPITTPGHHVEIHYWVFGNASDAQAKYQKVVHPGAMMGTTVTAVPQIGDQADIKRTPSYQLNSIEFVKGTAVVSIGVSPLVDDSLLKAAARKAITHL